MIELLFLVTLAFLGLRACVALRRESGVRLEFQQSSLLAWLTALYPLGPMVLVLGARFVNPPVLLLAVAAGYACALRVAARQTAALECAGTDRVDNARSATALASLGAIVGLIYVGLAGVFAFLGWAGQSSGLGF
jgi:hypothetical protein